MTLVYCFVTLTGRSSRLSLVKPPARRRRLPSQPLSADRRERSFPRVEVSILYIHIYIYIFFFNRTDFIHEMTTVCSQPDGFCVAPSVLLCLRHQSSLSTRLFVSLHHMWHDVDSALSSAHHRFLSCWSSHNSSEPLCGLLNSRFNADCFSLTQSLTDREFGGIAQSLCTKPCRGCYSE